MRFPTMRHVRPANAQTSLRIRAVWSEPLLEYSMTVKLLTAHHLEFLSFKGGCRGSSEPTLVKMSNCLKSHAAAHISLKEKYHAHQVAISAFLPIICVRIG